MAKLHPESKEVYMVGGVQLFSKADLATLLGVHRNTINKNILEWEVRSAAQCKRGNDLYLLHDYLTGQNRNRLSGDGDEKYGGYCDALEWKNAVAAKRDELRLRKDEGELVCAYEAERELATMLSDVSKMGEALLTIVDNVIHPSGELMAQCEKMFKQENDKYYHHLMEVTD